MSKKLLEGKNAIVTGTARGIGHKIVEVFAANGANVWACARKQTPEMDAYCKDLSEKYGVEVKPVYFELTDRNAMKDAFKSIMAEKKPIDVLVNNAGITRDNLLMRMKDDEWDQVINTNLAGIYRMSKGVLRGMMKKRWGRIISVSSVVGLMGNPGQCNYAAAKAGIMGFSRSLAKEVASRGITVTAVAPGFIATDMTDTLTEEQKKAILANVPAGELGAPEDIANTVAFLASDGARYITGEVISVNGGMYMC